MTVSELIIELLKMPMTAPVTIETDDGNETDIKSVSCTSWGTRYVSITTEVPITLVGGVFA